MDKKAMTYKGLELVGYAGEARSFLIEALMNARKGKFDKVDDLIKQAEKSIITAHTEQADLLMKEAQGKYSEPTITMVHGQDHLMTTLLLKEILPFMIELFKKSK